MYVDEVGNADLESSDNPNHRFLSLTGVIIELEHVRHVINSQMGGLKQAYFGTPPDEPVILHRKEMTNRKPPFESLHDPAVALRFDNDLLILLEDWEHTVITVCLAKKKHGETYTVWRYDPYHYCPAIPLERFNFWLNRCQGQGDVMAESRRGKEDRRLKDAFDRLWNQGTGYVRPEKFQKAFTSRQLKVKPKAMNISGLQLANLIAHPSRSEILSENGLLGRPLGAFAKRVVEIPGGNTTR